MQDHQLVELTGDGALQNIDVHLQTLLAAFRSERAVVLDLSAVGTVDISFIQLVAAAAETAARQGRSLSITGLPAAIETSFRRSGIDVAQVGRPNLQPESRACLRS